MEETLGIFDEVIQYRLQYIGRCYASLSGCQPDILRSAPFQELPNIFTENVIESVFLCIQLL